MSASSLKLLIVESNAAKRPAYLDILNNNEIYQFDIVFAKNTKSAEAALQLVNTALSKSTLPDNYKFETNNAATANFDCILLDCNLPDVDVLAFMTMLQNHKTHQLIPILATVETQDEISTANVVMSQGASSYIVKHKLSGKSLIQALQLAITTKQQVSAQLGKVMRVFIITDEGSESTRYQRLLAEAYGDQLECCCVSSVESRLGWLQHPQLVLLDDNVSDMAKKKLLSELEKISFEGITALPLVITLTDNKKQLSVAELFKKSGFQLLPVVGKFLAKSTLSVELLHNTIEFMLEKRKLLEQTLQKKDKFQTFIDAASHDLNAPVRRIGLYSQFLIDDLSEQLPESGMEYIEFILTNTRRLEHLVKSLVTYFSINKQENIFSQVSLDQVLTTAIANTQSSADRNDKNHSPITRASNEATNHLANQPIIEYQQLPTVTGDRYLLTQVFENLLANAIKFNKSAVVSINVSVDELEAHWRIAIKDNGIGIPATHHQVVFSPFNRLHSADLYQGTGLGLAICQKVIQLHYGNMWINSDDGTTVFILLPKSD